MKIICIGEALIDLICTDKGSPLSAGQHFLKKAGGAPTNVAAAIAALGGNVELAAKVGQDPFGKHLVEVMQGFGVSTKWMLQDNNFFTTFAFETKANVVKKLLSCNIHFVDTPKPCITSTKCFPKGSWPTLAANSTLPPSAAIAAATLVGAPPAFFKKCWPAESGLPLS